MSNWTDVCAVTEIDPEDVMRFDHEGRTFAIYRSPTGEVFATDGRCTHGGVHLSGGLVIDHVIECPKHNGRFDYRTGAALRVPACVALATWPARINGDRIEIAIGVSG